jgi:hypothetical protein
VKYDGIVRVYNTHHMHFRDRDTVDANANVYEFKHPCLRDVVAMYAVRKYYIPLSEIVRNLRHVFGFNASHPENDTAFETCERIFTFLMSG